MYDVTSPDSLRKVRDWVKELNKMLGSDNINLAIIGNKLDLLNINEQKCPQNNPIIKEALQLTNELMNAKHYLTTAKLNQGIVEMFVSLARRMMEQSDRQKAAKLNSTPHQQYPSSRVRPRSLAVKNDDTIQSDEPHFRATRGSLNGRLALASGGARKAKDSCKCLK